MAGKLGIRSGNSYKTFYKMYPARYTKNRLLKLERHLKKHPEDKIAKTAINNIKYRRKTPAIRVWSKSLITLAQSYKQAGLNPQELIEQKNVSRN